MNATVEKITIWTLLANEQRRQLLRELSARGSGTWTMDDLGAALATDGDLEQIRIALHHVHLPKLDAFGVISYDLDSGEVQFPYDEQRAERVESVLAAVEAVRERSEDGRG